MKNALAFVAAGLASSGSVSGQITEFDFQGKAGFGLLPGNEVGLLTPVGQGESSPAFGGEVGSGLVFDASTNILSYDFEFNGLTGGLADVASGIHFHLVTDDDVDPFDFTGAIAFNLNSGGDGNVVLSTPLIVPGPSVTSGRVTGTAQLSASRVDDLFAGRFYLNIHSAGYQGGELRGNIVVPAPATMVLGLTGLGGLILRRR